MSLKCKNCGASITRIQEIGPGFGGKGWCVYCEGSMPSAKDARIAALEAALAKAEEALKEAPCTSPKLALCIFSPALGCPRCAALAAIKEARND